MNNARDVLKKLIMDLELDEKNNRMMMMALIPKYCNAVSFAY